MLLPDTIARRDYCATIKKITIYFPIRRVKASWLLDDWVLFFFWVGGGYYFNNFTLGSICNTGKALFQY